MTTKLQKYLRAKQDPVSEIVRLRTELESIKANMDSFLLDKKLIGDSIAEIREIKESDGTKRRFTEGEILQAISYIEKRVRIPNDGKDGEHGRDGVDGLPGKDGEKGDDGYTPIAGKDYPTEKQVRALINTEVAYLFSLKPKNDTKGVTKKEVDRLIGKIQKKIDFNEVARGLETLKGKAKLDYNALKNTPDIPSKNKIDQQVRTIMRGGGDRVRPHSITGDGSTKTFTIPSNKRIIAVFASDFPYIYKPTTDYGTSGAGNITLTFTSEVNAPSNGSTVEVLYVE